MNRYRHEYKYILNASQEAILQVRAMGALERDVHADINGLYTVRSLYFDDYLNTCYYENQNGTYVRSKFRLRYYDDRANEIMLEKKSKYCGMTLKESCRMSRDECIRLVEGKEIEVDRDMSYRKKKLLLEMQKRMLKPKVIVTYDRVPFVYSVGNVRITFDKNITSSDQVEEFLGMKYRQYPIMGVGKCVLEIKWDELLPLHIKEMMQMDTLQWSAFSKYYMSRKCLGR